MKLQRHFAYKYKEKNHFKYVVTLPTETIDQLGWKPETDLTVIISNKTIILKPQNRTETVTSEPRKEKRTEHSGESH